MYIIYDNFEDEYLVKLDGEDGEETWGYDFDGLGDIDDKPLVFTTLSEAEAWVYRIRKNELEGLMEERGGQQEDYKDFDAFRTSCQDLLAGGIQIAEVEEITKWHIIDDSEEIDEE